jgi:predicted TIM-barrel fold metal-dependent hydrolase
MQHSPDPARPLPTRFVDAHQHFWDPDRNYHPWLRDEPPIPFRYGDYRALKRRYLPDDYRADAARAGVEILGTVYVETEWDPSDAVGEMRYVATLRETTGLPSVAVAQAWLDRDDCVSQLERLRSFDFVRGIRHKPRANGAAGDGAPGGMTEPAWLAGFQALAASGLRFDLQTPWWHLHEAAHLADRFPSTRIILNHTGLPSDRSDAGLEGWGRAMQRLAACDNVVVKVSGLGQTAPPRWSAADNAVPILRTIDWFGIHRCLFASNFPVDGLCADLATVMDGFRSIAARFDADEQHRLFASNAIAVYALPPANEVDR